MSHEANSIMWGFGVDDVLDSHLIVADSRRDAAIASRV